MATYSSVHSNESKQDFLCYKCLKELPTQKKNKAKSNKIRGKKRQTEDLRNFKFALVFIQNVFAQKFINQMEDLSYFAIWIFTDLLSQYLDTKTQKQTF